MHPAVFLIVALALLWLAMALGSWLRRRDPVLVESEHTMITVLQGALLTLFGLLMGFAFSMAVSRFERRVELVVNEANAIGTAWLRAQTLDEPVRSQEQALLREYVAERVRFFDVRARPAEVTASLARASELQSEMWAAASSYATGHRDPVTGLFLSALGECTDLAEQRTSAYENRIPGLTWTMLLFVACAATLMLGLGVRSRSRVLKAVLPVVLAGVLALTMDMDDPYSGLVSVRQTSMLRTAEMMGRR